MPDIFVSSSKKTALKEKGGKNIRINTFKPISDEPINKNPVHLFSSFCVKPTDISFRNQEHGETVLLFLRKHIITNIKWFIASILLIIAPLFLNITISILQIPIALFPLKYLIFMLSFYYLIVASYIYISFITWYFNLSLVTNIRIIDIDFSNLIYKNIAATKLSQVQDVSFDQIGVIPTFFDYGNVLVQTAGTLDNFDFDECPQPENVVHIVEDLIGKDGSI